MHYNIWRKTNVLLCSFDHEHKYIPTQACNWYRAWLMRSRESNSQPLAYIWINGCITTLQGNKQCSCMLHLSTIYTYIYACHSYRPCLVRSRQSTSEPLAFLRVKKPFAPRPDLYKTNAGNNLITHCAPSSENDVAQRGGNCDNGEADLTSSRQIFS